VLMGIGTDEKLTYGLKIHPTLARTMALLARTVMRNIE